MIVSLQVTHFSDPGCPWAWSASPAIAALQWRYGDQLELAARDDRPDRERRRLRGARLHAGRPGARVPHLPPARHAVRHRAARARPRHVADVPRRRRRPPPAPEREWAVFRALQFAQFTSTLDLEDADELARGDRLGPRHRRRRDRARPRTTRRPRPRSTRTATRPAPPRARPTEFQGKSRQHRRPRALHGAEHPLHGEHGRRSRPAASSRRGLRRADRQPRPALAAARPPTTPPRSCRVPGRPDDRRGRRRSWRRGQVRARPRRGRGRADRRDRRRRRARALPFGHDALWVPSAPVALAQAA